MFSNSRISTSTVKEGFIATAPLRMYESKSMKSLTKTAKYAQPFTSGKSGFNFRPSLLRWFFSLGDSSDFVGH